MGDKVIDWVVLFGTAILGWAFTGFLLWVGWNYGLVHFTYARDVGYPACVALSIGLTALASPFKSHRR